MNRYSVFVACSVVFVLALASCGFGGEKGFSGTLYLRNGDSVFFDHLGTTSEVAAYHVSGRLGQQRVAYNFADLGLILLSDKEPSTVIIVNKQGERFTLTDCELKDGFLYVYNDPVTHKLDWTRAERKDISHIVVGERSGKIKMNVTTREFFPAMFVFDPFTGERLVWAEHGHVIPGEAPGPAQAGGAWSGATYTPAAAQPAPRAPAAVSAVPSPAPIPAGATSDLHLTITTPQLAVIFLGDADLSVTIKGPERFEKRVKNADADRQYTLDFKKIPSGDYKVVAKYGSRTAVSIVRVLGKDVSSELMFD
ncbi:MAG TPA: hypothetical protein VM163_07910 [bacterium]|nr:hypothetical protein [bacterium]